jgi:hypothetical protein
MACLRPLDHIHHSHRTACSRLPEYKACWTPLDPHMGDESSQAPHYKKSLGGSDHHMAHYYCSNGSWRKCGRTKKWGLDCEHSLRWWSEWSMVRLGHLERSKSCRRRAHLMSLMGQRLFHWMKWTKQKVRKWNLS